MAGPRREFRISGALQTKGTRGDKAILKRLALREKRLNADTAHSVAAVKQRHCEAALSLPAVSGRGFPRKVVENAHSLSYLFS